MYYIFKLSAGLKTNISELTKLAMEESTGAVRTAGVLSVKRIRKGRRCYGL